MFCQVVCDVSVRSLCPVRGGNELFPRRDDCAQRPVATPGHAATGTRTARGDSRLSLWGGGKPRSYFKKLRSGGRVNINEPTASKVLLKPTLQVKHEGENASRPGRRNIGSCWTGSGQAPLRIRTKRPTWSRSPYHQGWQCSPLRGTRWR